MKKHIYFIISGLLSFCQADACASVANQSTSQNSLFHTIVCEPWLAGVLSFLLLSMILFVVIVMRYVYKLRRSKELLTDDYRKALLLQERLRQAKAKAEESDQQKMMFLSNMSHEIRTPLNAIVGFSSILTDKESNELSEEERTIYGNLIEQNTEALLQLVNDVLDLSELEADLSDFKYSDVELGGCCRMIASSFEYKAGKNVKITFSPSIEPFILSTNQPRLEQVFSNLLSNAIKFTKEGSVNLSYNVDREKGEVCFAVTDTGVSIPPEKQQVVFGRFIKMNDYIPGTGLGLSICALIAKRFGGRIYVDGNYKGGTRVVFTHKIFTEEKLKNQNSRL